MEQMSALSISPLGDSKIAHNAGLSAPQKAAVIIALLGPEYASPVVEKIEDKHLRSFMHALENLRLIPRETILAAVADFITELEARRGGLRGGPEAAKELAQSIFATDRAARLFGAGGAKPKAAQTSSDAVWFELRLKKANDIAKYLGSKPSAVISIILSQFSTDVAGEILSELPEELSVACVGQMSKGENIDDRTIAAVAELIQIEFLTAVQGEDDSSSVTFVSEILGILPRDRRDMMLDRLDKTDPKQADLIRKGMITFEDLPSRLPTTAIPIIFKDFDSEKLLKALKAGGDQEPATIEFFFANISQRMAGQYKEQVEELAGISQKESDSAISSLMGYISKLEKDGRITLIKPISADI